MTASAAAVTTLVKPGAFSAEWQAGLRLLGNPAGGLDSSGQVPTFLYTAEHTLLLAAYATGIAVLVGVPVGCLLGIGRFPGRRALIAIGNALTRVPPVVVGVVVVLLIGGETEYGGQATIIPPPEGYGRVFAGPLSGISWIYPHRDVVAQSLLALPIMIGLTATAMQRLPAGLLDQAQAFGASGWRRGLLAVRESRRALLAATIVATGITITAVGALYVVQGGYVASCPVVNGGYSAATCDRSDSLAASALLNWQTANGGHGGHLADSGTVAFAYSQVLIGMFFVLAAGLTFLQRNRTSWTPVARS